MTEQKNVGKSHLRNDIILIAGLALVSVIGLIYLFVFREGGNTVKVTVDGETYGIYSLSDDISEDIITGENNEHSNRFVIRDGKAYMEYASCPDGICVSHRPVFRDGESIVCLPNKVVITVITDNTSDSVDIVA